MLGLSVFGKSLHPEATLSVLRSVWGLGATPADVAFLLLLVVESALVVWLVWPDGASLALLGTAAFLLAVSVSPIRQILAGDTSDCGCGIAALVGQASGPGAALGRNALLISACLLTACRAPVRVTNQRPFTIASHT